MKKLLSFFFVVLLFCFSLVGCVNHKVTYILDQIVITKVNIYEPISIEVFDEKYPGFIADIGRDIVLNNNNNFIFNGKISKDIDGKCEITDDKMYGYYITFSDDSFYNLYGTASIYNGRLCIETKMLAIGEPISTFIFVYSKL